MSMRVGQLFSNRKRIGLCVKVMRTAWCPRSKQQIYPGLLNAKENHMCYDEVQVAFCAFPSMQKAFSRCGGRQC